jgi:aminopeptidase N
VLDRLGGWTPKPAESEELQELRSAALFIMGSAARDPEVLREARRLAALHIAGTARLHPSIVETALQLAAIEGDPALYKEYLSHATGSASAAEQYQYLSALAFFEDPVLRKRTLEYAMSSSIRAQDAPMLIHGLMQRREGSAATWEYIRNNWEQVERSFGIFQGIPGVIASLQHLCDAASASEIDQFFSRQTVAGADRTLRRSLESVQRCTATKSAQAKNLTEFLAQN